ncbi:MAG: hypothetical protein R2684_07270 [Pyrinomonadaceae bacterium]
MANASVIVIFIDGIGIGLFDDSNPFTRNWRTNPFARFVDRDFNEWNGSNTVKTDPRLGVEGRPQSASGQTTILTGINAPKVLGNHKQGFPNQKLRELIREASIFKRLSAILPKNDVTFANAYTPQFFDSVPRFKSATTCAVEAAGLRFRNLDDIRNGNALFHDFSNRTLIENGHELQELSPEMAGESLANLGSEKQFVLYEHFITDKIGHERDFERAVKHLQGLSAFVRTVVERSDLAKTTIILTSDHGNMEDLSIRNHTLNDVPTIIWGRSKDAAAEDVRDLTDISKVVLRLLG